MERPEYRLRLYLSVDLVGSTAFKAGLGAEMSETPPQPRWVREIRNFYSAFPDLLEREFLETTRTQSATEHDRCTSPRLWKRIGDELVFCCKVEHLDHLARCILAFVKALDGFGDQLDSGGKQLDVKGSAWVAAFPHPNITIQIADDRASEDEHPSDFPTEELERAADETPSSFDFLGPAIDGGFRIAKFASADRCALSVETAWLLARACFDERAYPLKFFYHDRQELKGVLRDHPYPVITIDTERSDTRKDVLFRERLMTGRSAAEPRLLFDFLVAFMADEGIEQPALAIAEAPIVPASYSAFLEAWATRLTELQKTSELADASENAGAGPDKGDEQDVATERRLYDAFEKSRRRQRPEQTSVVLVEQSQAAPEAPPNQARGIE